jgi:hypothetical protein
LDRILDVDRTQPTVNVPGRVSIWILQRDDRSAYDEDAAGLAFSGEQRHEIVKDLADLQWS